MTKFQDWKEPWPFWSRDACAEHSWKRTPQLPHPFLQMRLSCVRVSVAEWKWQQASWLSASEGRPHQPSSRVNNIHTKTTAELNLPQHHHTESYHHLLWPTSSSTRPSNPTKAISNCRSNQVKSYSSDILTYSKLDTRMFSVKGPMETGRGVCGLNCSSIALVPIGYRFLYIISTLYFRLSYT